MVGTIFSILIAIFVWLHPISEEAISSPYTSAIMLAIALLFLFFVPAGIMMAWGPLQKAEKNSSPRIMEMYHGDWMMNVGGAWIALFALFSIFLVIVGFQQHLLNKLMMFIVWIVLLGVTVDVARNFVSKISNYLNPNAVARMFTHKAKKSIQEDREIDLCNWIDALAEVALKGIQGHGIAMSNLVIGELQDISSLFLDASKSIAHQEQDEQTRALGIKDKVSYTMFYLYQRLDLLFNQALKNKLETTCTQLATLLGKIAIAAAKYDVSMASTPLRVLAKCAKKAQEEGLEETTLTASCTFSEVAKTIVNEIDISYYEIKDPFLSIINGLEILAKGAFRRDKTLTIPYLIQPFTELKALFELDKTKNHQDTPVIMQNINRVLGEFEALQLVMNTIPPIPNIPETETIPPPPPPTRA